MTPRKEKFSYENFSDGGCLPPNPREYFSLGNRKDGGCE